MFITRKDFFCLPKKIQLKPEPPFPAPALGSDRPKIGSGFGATLTNGGFRRLWLRSTGRCLVKRIYSVRGAVRSIKTLFSYSKSCAR